MQNLKAHFLSTGTYAMIVIWSALAGYLSISDQTIGLSDMFGFITRAESLSFDSLSPWVHGLYPLGYPAVLKGLSLKIMSRPSVLSRYFQAF